MRTPCGLRTVVTILEIFAELLGDTFGKVPCYNTVENWVKKLGLSVYQDDQPCRDKKFAMVVDESIAVNGHKLLLTLAIPSEHQKRPIKHEDVTTLDMSVSKASTAMMFKAEWRKLRNLQEMALQILSVDSPHKTVSQISSCNGTGTLSVSV